MSITAEQVKQLRERTGAGMMECKKALVETGGDLDAAAELMRKQGLAKADKKAARVAADDAGNVYGGFTNTLTINGSAAGVNAYQILIAATPAVPEPETWAMMIAGMGVVGAMAMRARRRPLDQAATA